ncbi:MAG: ABC transporter substrate-binding protein [Desulfobacteraceae bacterium]|nr:ABC transporter substrate-binding protein [Desulfobacteraceae bacterium]
MKIKKHFILAVAVACFVCTSPSEAYRLRLQWIPQTQFAGYYMAAEKGFYKEAGVDVVIMPVNPKIKCLHDVMYKKGDFETAWLASGITMRSNSPKKIVLIAQFFQKPALMLVARKSSKINEIRDFSGRRLGVWSGVFSVLPRALLIKNRDRGVHSVKMIPQGFTIKPFLNGEIDVASAMRYNEYKQILDAGISEKDLKIFDFSELGMNLPEDGLYVRENFLKNNPEICRKVVAATVKGWKYAFAHKNETVSLITEIAGKNDHKTTKNKQRWMLDVVESLIDPNNTALKKDDFERAADMLRTLKMIRKIPSYEKFFKNVMK